MNATLTPNAPVAAVKPEKRTLHGKTRVDPYAWLKDDNWQEVMRDPSLLGAEIKAHLDAENAYSRAAMADTQALQESLFKEMRGRIKEDDSSVPEKDGQYSYYVRYRQGGEHPVFCRYLNETQEEQILLDADAEAADKDYYHVGGCDHSHDHRLLAYAIDQNGSEVYTIAMRVIASAEILSDRIDNAHGDFAWAADNEHLFYTVLDDKHRPSRVYRHRLGDDSCNDVLVYEEPDAGFFVGVGLTESRRFVTIEAHDHETSEVRLIESTAPVSQPRIVAKREPGVEYSVSHSQLDGVDELLILTNAGDAEDFQVMRVPLDAPQRENWHSLIAHRAGTLIASMDVYKDYLVRLERENALPRIVVRVLATGDEHSIAFDEEAYSLGLSAGLEFDTTNVRFTYSSPTTPARVHDYDMRTRSRVVRKEQTVPSGHGPADYVTRRLSMPSHDGEQVPVTVLHRADTQVGPDTPVLVYGYGSYGYDMPASFGTARLSLVDRGFVYALAHIRGGMDRGYRWYTDGKRMKKKNTFKDFIAAAEGLGRQGYGSPGNLACLGGSAGGMLVGAVVNLRPDLWKAAVGEVPFVDVLNTMCDDTLPLTPPEWPEWGNPITDADAYDYIASYSPYENIEAKAYPNILATAGLTDPRVTYWEPAKWIARLRITRTDTGLTLLKTNMSAGHAGASGRFDSLKETAFVYAFLLKVFERAA